MDGSRSASASVPMGTTTGDDPGPIWTALLSTQWSRLTVDQQPLQIQWMGSYGQAMELY